MKCVAYELFNNRYLVSLPNSACISPKELELFGMMDMGSDEENRAYLNELRHTYVNIPMLAQHVFNGVPITLNSSKDGFEIYNLVDTHLENCIWVAQHVMNSRLPPFDDLVMLDELASNTHVFNVKHDSDEFITLKLFSVYGDAPKFYSKEDDHYQSKLERLFGLQGRRRHRGKQ